jgi:hypothetical protein
MNRASLTMVFYGLESAAVKYYRQWNLAATFWRSSNGDVLKTSEVR